MSEHHASLTFGIEADAYPLDEQIVLRLGIAGFESQLSLIPTASPDSEFLSSIVWGTCYAGAADFPIHPFICVPRRPLSALPTAAEVLAELRISTFQSEHIASLNSTHIPYPGYNPGTKNDEIHTDPGKQYLFALQAIDAESDEGTDEAGEFGDLSRSAHAALRSYVLSGHLFYILIHDQPKPYDGFMLSNLVLLFAVGMSPQTGHLVGVVSCQVCHNLCD